MADPTGAPFDPFAAQKAANQAQMLAKLLQEQGPYEPPQQPQMAGRLVVPFSPVAGAAGALAQGLDAWGKRKAQKNAIDKENELEQGRAQIYAKALQPQVDPKLLAEQQDTQTPGTIENQAGSMVQPSSSSVMQAIMQGGDPKMIGPALAEALRTSMGRDSKANEPITPYEQSQLARQAKMDDPDYQARLKALPGPVAQPKPQAVVDQEMALKAAPGAPPQPTAGMSPEAFTQAQKLAQIKANLAAQTQGEFGRSMNGKAYNILAGGLTNDAARATPEYATAWQILSNPHVDPNTGTIVTPDLSAFKPPLGAQQPPAPGQPAPAPGSPPPQRMPSVQSFAPPNPSQAEAGSAGYANRLSESSGIIDKTQGAGTSMINRGVASLPGGNYLVGSDYQQLDQAERNFVNAQLRRESGAAISESEFQNARKQYFPQPGDKPEVLAQKKKARDMAVQNMQLSAGNVLLPPGVVQQSSPPKGAPMVPQQQGFGAQAAPQGGGGAPPQRIGRFTVEPVGP